MAYKKYEQLDEDLKAEAQEMHPEDYKEWEYYTQGVEIAFSAR